MKVKYVFRLCLCFGAALLISGCSMFFSRDRGEGTVTLSFGAGGGRFAVANYVAELPEFMLYGVEAFQNGTSVKKV